MSNTISSAADLIAELGGPKAVAEMLGVGYTAVTNMRMRGSFPPKYWPELIRRAATKGLKGVDLDFLERLSKANGTQSTQPVTAAAAE